MWGGWVVAVVVGTWAAVVTAADAPITAASLTADITVARAGGATVKGRITSCTPELLTVQPDPKPVPKGAKPPAVEPPTPDPVEVPWADVRHVSNGLTARRALDVWKAQHAAELCPTCRGERTVVCPTCKGTRHDPAAAANCKTCHGELLVACKTPGEHDGQIACPNGCLQLKVGTWVKHPDGLLWRTFVVGKGSTVFYSEHHAGDVILLDLKNHSGDDAGKCPVCGGTQAIDDPACHGTGKLPCPECLTRKAAACPNHCDAGRVACPTCKGSGLAAKA